MIPLLEQEHHGSRPSDLDPDEPGPLRHCTLDLPEVGGLDKGKCEPEVFKHAPEEAVGAAVDIARGDDVIPLLEQEHHGSRRSHAGGECKAVFG